MDLSDLSEPARKLLCDIAGGKVLTSVRVSAQGPYWTLDGKPIDEFMGPRELQEKGLLHNVIFSGQLTPQPVSLTEAGIDAARQICGA